MIGSSVTFDGTKGLLETAVDAGVLSFFRTPVRTLVRFKSDDASTSRNQVYQPLERRLNGIEIFVDVGVIEFDRSQNYGIWKVVQKLRAFIEEGRVIFVTFENEVLSLAQA